MRVLRVLILLALTTASATSQDFRSVTVRYELTATVRVGDRITSGSAIWEAIIKDGPDVFFQYGPTFDMSGEAIEVKQAQGPSIFLLRRGARPPQDFLGISSLPYGAFVVECIGLDAASPEYMDALSEFEGTCSSKATPVMVRFGNPADATSIEILEYGPDRPFELLGVEISATSSPVTSSVARSLPWLFSMREDTNVRTGATDGLTSAGYFLIANQIYALDFKKRHNTE